jgi:hypothetical protein
LPCREAHSLYGTTAVIHFGAHKLPLPPEHSSDDRTKHTKGMLYRSLNMRTTVAVVGSGCTTSLGYPNWQQFAEGLVRTTLTWLRNRRDRDQGKVQRDVERFEGFAKTLRRRDAKLTSESLTFYIGACQRVALTATERRAENPYLKYLGSRFAQPKSGSLEAPNACRKLVELPIQRFLTTNYDREIEKALINQRRLDPSRFGAIAKRMCCEA